MTDRTDAIVQALFDKPSLQECSLQQVDYMAHQYPFFTTAQLLLLQKAKPDTEPYKAQLQRTALHFSNPLQLAHWLHPALFDTEIPEPQLFQNPMPGNSDETEAAPRADEAPAEPLLPVAPVEVENPAVPEAPPAAPPESAAKAQPEEMPQPEPAALAFEPYHTVDYFASQGIKLSQQEAASDTLGRQLKSFTEWLKTMKRLPQAAAAQPADAAREEKVAHLAAHSLDTSDVVTESMAEVWLKQGAIEKAVEVYAKLSLRNPLKSAYFAAKIELLKQ